MKGSRVIKFLSVFFVCIPFCGFARQNSFSSDSSLNRRFVFESSVGLIGFVNNQITRPSFSLRTGYGNYFLTARFLRSDKGTSYTFENCWLAGYRFNLGERFNATLSAGAGDIAFVFNYSSFEEDILHETVGLTFDVEAQWNMYRRGAPSAWSMFANYHATFNEYNNLNGFLTGVSFCPTRVRNTFFSEKRQKRIKAIQEKASAKEQRQAQREINRINSNPLASDTSEVTSWKGAYVHWENSVFMGFADRPMMGGFISFFEVKRFIIGANYSATIKKTWTEEYVPAGNPPYAYTKTYFRDKQNENAIFAGYRVWETASVGLNVCGGISWKRNQIYSAADPGVYTISYHLKESKMLTGLALQSELSYTFPNRRFGAALIQFASFYKGYSSAGAAFSLRFGILR